jgi:hypothetical protein
MTVIVRHLQNGGQGGIQTEFFDSFNRASSSDLGVNWFDTTLQSTPIINPIGSSTYSIGAAVDAVQAMLVSYSGLANPATQWQTMLCALPVRNVTRTVNQFVEAQFINQSGPAVTQPQFGPCCMINDQLGNDYELSISGIVAPHAVALQRHNGTTVAVLAAFGAICISGSLLRLAVDVTDLANIRLEVFHNNVSLGATIDNSASRLTVGYSGGFREEQYGFAGGIPSHSQWRNFRCGIGSGS